MKHKQKKEHFDFLSEVVRKYDDLKYALLEAQTFHPDHYGFPAFYYEVMSSDQKRVNAFKRCFAHYDFFRDKVVCEVGVGTLALTQHYLPYVKKAYLIESNPELIPGIQNELQKNGWEHKVVLIHADALQTSLAEPLDFLIGELMSIFCANELQVQIFHHMQQFLKPKGIMIPEKILNLAQLCTADFESGYKHYPIFFSRHLPEILSTQELINIIDLYQVEEIQQSHQTLFRPQLSGTINGVYLHSWIQLAEGFNFTGTDSLMPPTVVQLEKPMEIKARQEVSLLSEYSYGTNLNQASFSLSSV